MKYPTPSIFEDIFEDSNRFNEETNRLLSQMTLQAEFGILTLAFLLERLREGDLQILQKFPIPKTIHPEDGYKFMLSSSQKELEAKGDLPLFCHFEKRKISGLLQTLDTIMNLAIAFQSLSFNYLCRKSP